jgi:eukaryotic-like serine/threonine-protein kinase
MDRERIEALFDEALELPPDARAGFVARASGGDPALADAVSALLRAHDLDSGILERGPARSARPPADPRIGPYRVLDEVARGGMGVVYLAERDDGQFRRRVAVKVIRSDGDPDLPARMVAERQILASLSHPAIASMLDGGVTDDGRPYLVMEYVAGLPIDVYCDRLRLSVRERLELVLEVARGVNHAHHNLIVHRDLKPSNILVTPDGRPKLLDFGIAKILNPGLAVDAPVTRGERRVMTPEYASPEQLRGEALTTASDIYSLGVVLYRLLTGTSPYRVPDGDLAAILLAVMQEDPPRPSLRIATRAAGGPAAGSGTTVPATRIAADRSTTPDRLRRALSGDLDAIVMKALRKEATRRYASAELLAQDLEAYLAGTPVRARQGNRWYRARKLVQRHKVGAAATLLAALALGAGAVVAGWQAGIAARERDRATHALGQAEVALAQSREVTDFLMGLFDAGAPGTVNADVTARDLLDRGLARAEGLASQPAVHGRLLDVIGQMHHRLGRYDDAVRVLAQAVDVRRSALGGGHPDVAESLLHLSRVQRAIARQEDAERAAVEAVGILRAGVPPDDPRLGEALYDLGWVRPGPEQERLYREALAVYEANGGHLPRQVSIMHGLSTNLRRQGRLEEGIAMDRAALELARRELGPDHPSTAYAMIHLADHVRDIEGDLGEAEQLYRTGLELQARHGGENNTALIHGLFSLADVRSRQGDHAEAERLIRHALAVRRAATGPDHPGVAGATEYLARMVARQGRAEEAELLARQAMDAYDRVVGRNHPSYVQAVANLANVYAELGRFDLAVDTLRAAIGLRSWTGSMVTLGEQHRRLGRYLAASGRRSDAEAELLRSLAILEAEYPDRGHPNILETRRALAELYTAWGREADAAAYATPPGRFLPH